MAPTTRTSDFSLGWSWDVFLSFRGEDTRLTFTDRLYSALCQQKGIRTFRDDEGLNRGEEIGSSLLKAIEGSRICIVVFSKTYAHSKWCLDELAKIMRGKAQKRQTVLPVFYHVDPSDVRNQTGSFGEAFDKHQNVPEDKVMRWKAALTEAANLSGWRVQDGNESQTIQKIVDYILSGNLKLSPTGDKLIGMERRLQEMDSLIQIDSNDVFMIGIYGITGIGKTTLAKVVYDEIVHQFDGASFLSNISRQKTNLLQLQKQLLRDILGGDIPTISNISEGSNEIRNIFMSKKVLVVLDDVEFKEQLDCLSPNHKEFGLGSRIIVTSRDKHFLLWCQVDALYELNQLNFNEAIQHFSLHAFHMNSPPEGFEHLSCHIVQYCMGLPIALKVQGSFLFGKKNFEWESELQRLEKQPIDLIQKLLVSCLETLYTSEKDIFLDVACFFNGEDLDFVQRILDACYSSAKPRMQALDDKSLISVLDNKLLMDDLMQRIGWEIVRQECPHEPGKWSRLWNLRDVFHVLRTNTGTKRIEGIFLNMSESNEIHLTSNAFIFMTRLRLLRVYHNAENNSIVSNTVHLPRDFEFPSHELRYLHWDGWTLESLPSNFDGWNLVELSLKHSSLKHLWKKVKLLPELQVINLGNSQRLMECPNLSFAPRVELLILDGCTSLPEVHPSVTKLKRLTILNMQNCKMLHYFPSITGLESLKVLNLSGCSKLDKFPEIQGYMEYLLELNLEGTAIVELPPSVVFLPRLVLLDMQNCKNLMILPSNIYSLKSLGTLVLSGCSGLERFPEIMQVMECLQKLLLDGTSIKELPPSIDRLEGLQLLNMRECKHLTSLPNSICSLRSLETLIVSGCSKLSKLPEDLGRLQFLMKLQADGIAITQPPL